MSGVGTLRIGSQNNSEYYYGSFYNKGAEGAKKSYNEQISQSHSVGDLPMPQTNSNTKLDTINEAAQHNEAVTPTNFDEFARLDRSKPREPSISKPIDRSGIGRHMPMNQQRPGGLCGIGGSIITSSGMNQNFKDFANQQDPLKINNAQGAAHSSSTGMFSKPNFSPGHSPTAGAAMNN